MTPSAEAARAPGRRGRRTVPAFLPAVLLAVLAAVAFPARAEFRVPPPPPRFLYDGVGLLSPAERARIEERLLELDRERGLQVGVAILPSLGGEPVEEATLRIAEAWKPGHRGRDDGVLLAVFTKDRRMRIEVGYGLEGAIPDITAGRILREQIAPEFRAGRFAAGILRGVEAIAAAAAGETLPPPARPPGGVRRRGISPLLVLPFQLFVLLVVVLAFVARGIAARQRALHPGRPLRRAEVPWWVWLLLASNAGRGRGGFSGGGFGGGGGGFGGGSFGGGSFGGGGASGGW